MDVKKLIFDNQDYFEDFISRSTYHTNAIEGNTLSYAETYAILFNDNDFKVSATPREIYEAINHKYAINYILSHLDEELSERLIKEAAVLINKNISEIAGYRTVSVRIKGAQHVPPVPNQVPQQMMYFVYNYNHTEYEDIFQKLAETHIQYERIHPFEDGNGRTGRLILNFELIRNNMPPIVIPKDDRTKYFGMLAAQNSQELAGFFKELCQEEQKRIEALAGCRKESVVERLNRYKEQVQDDCAKKAKMQGKSVSEKQESVR